MFISFVQLYQPNEYNLCTRAPFFVWWIEPKKYNPYKVWIGIKPSSINFKIMCEEHWYSAVHKHLTDLSEWFVIPTIYCDVTTQSLLSICRDQHPVNIDVSLHEA